VRAELAAQVRAAYLIGPREPLRLLLNQQDPARVGRNLAYYGYFGRARASQADDIGALISRIDEDDAKIASEEAELTRLAEARRSQLEDLEDARRQRSKVLANLTAEARDRQQSLQRLQRQQAALEKLLKDLNRALQDFPVDPNAAFAKLRGQLAWPAAGKLAARFGETRAGGVRWNGVLIASERGTPVKAVSQGRVAYADYGSGYLSLYGHNERLLKAAGAEVRAGEPIAAVGDSGGRAQPELYFEIRRAGKPVDPQPWFRNRAP
jgi:septal ring factor EnvC (AmiA/AmiB activator)